jgi:hypothetical protein
MCIPIFLGASAASAASAEIAGPGRFCGYSPIIDLKTGERVIPLQGGIHGGSFRWEGAFGALEVEGVGWASKPRGRVTQKRTTTGQTRFTERREGGKFTVAIWNRGHGAAYFSSPRPITPEQIQAIDRVYLFEEGEGPQGCNLRTIFSWE